MPNVITGYLAPSFKFSADSVFTATRNAVPQTITVAAGGGATWYRHYLAATGGTGTAATSPKEFGAYVKGLMNTAHGVSDWNVRMAASGKWEITNTAQAWSITWDNTGGTDKIARSCLGFTGNISGSANQYATATVLPEFVAAFIARDNDTYWQSSQDRAGATMNSGIGYGWRAGATGVLWTRSFDVVAVPAGTAFQSEQSALGTPVIAATRMYAPMLVPATNDELYAWSDFVNGYDHAEIGAAIGSIAQDISTNTLSTFDKVVAGTTAHFDKVYLHHDFLERFKSEPMRRNWWGQYTLPGVRLSRSSFGVIT